jgi:predicted acyltransferase
MNPILAFLGTGAMGRLVGSNITVMRGGQKVPIKAVIYDRFFASWLDPRSASLLYAVTFVLLWAGICGLLYRKRIFFKV